MKRKIFAWIMALAMVMTMLPMPEVHTHAHAEEECTHSSWEYVNQGQKKCSDCGTLCDDLSIPRNYIWKSVNKQTQTIAWRFKCPAGHTHNSSYSYTVEEKAATCESNKKTVYTSTVDPNLVVEEETLNTKVDHNWENGVCTYGCGTVHEPHDWEEGKCEVCGASCDHDGEAYKYEHIEGTEGNNSKHKWMYADCGAVVISSWSCSDAKDYNGLCDNCGHEMYHSVGTQATCTTPAICQHCGEPYGETLGGHIWENGVCTRDGCGEECNHSWKNYDGKCTECGMQHAHDACDGKTCSVCKYNYNNMRGDHPDNYPFDGHCDACGECLDQSTDSEAGTNRKYWSEEYTQGYDNTHHWTVCNLGHVVSKKVEHTLDENGECTDGCGFQCAHANKVVKHVATTEGYFAKHAEQCPTCGWISDVQFNCNIFDSDQDGVCNICEYEYQHYHDWSNKDGICADEDCGEVCGHNWSNKDGVCAVCGVTHRCDYDNLTYEHIEGTEGAASKHNWFCPVCGYSFGKNVLCIDKDANGDGICDQCKFEYEHKNHKWNNYAGKCTVCGEQHPHNGCNDTKCEICGFQPASDHFDFFDAEGNLGADGHCDSCGDCFAFGKWITKNTGWDETHHWDECLQGHKIDESAEAHTLDENGKCTVCEFECAHEAEADDGDCTTAVYCALGCGAVMVPAKDDHVAEADDGDCTTAVKCENCDYIFTAAEEDHDWQYRGLQSGGCKCANCEKTCGELATIDVEASIEKTRQVGSHLWKNNPKFQIIKVHACGNPSHMPTTTFDALSSTEAATCTEPETTTYWAENYPEIKIVVPNGEELGHDWQPDGTCARGCGETCDHADKVVKHIATTEGYFAKHAEQCPTCGWISTVQFNCNIFDSDQNGICNICEYEYQHYHDWSNKDGICAKEDCGEECGHNWIKEDGICQICGFECEHPSWGDEGCEVCGLDCEHTYVFEHIEGTEGYKAIHDWYCTECGFVLVNDALCYNNDNNGDGICDKCEYEYEHKNHVEKTPATCTTKAVCEICGEKYGEPLGHGEYVYEHIEGTEGNASMHKGSCGKCDEVIFVQWHCADEDTDHKCDNCGYTLSDHNFVAESDGAGKHTMKCDFCGISGTTSFCEDGKVIDGLCDKCGYELPVLPPHEHKYNFDAKPQSTGEGEHFYTCTCGDEYTIKCADYNGDGLCDSCGYELFHAGGTPTCGMQNICQNCGEPYGEVLDHDWSNKDGVCARGCGETCEHPNEKAVSNGKGQHMLVCDDCGNTYGDLLLNCREGEVAGVCASCDYEMYHAGGTPTCTEQAICQNCGLPYGKTLPHTWKFNEEASTLNVEKKTFNIVIDCSECGKVYPIATTWNAETEVTQEGDCVTPELTKFYTSGNAWGVAFEIEEIVETAPATGEHNLELVKTEEATCEYPAYYWYECTECDYGKNYEDPTGALADHIPETDDGNCTTAVLCSVCDEVIVEANAEHNYEVVKTEPATCEYPAYFWYECSECDWEKNGEDPTGALADHIPETDDGNCTTAVLCSVCDEVIVEANAEHNLELVKTQAADCQYPAYYWYECTECDYGKNYEDPTGALGDHVNNDGDKNCDVCGEKLVIDCDHEGKGTYTFTVEANCSNEGYVEVYCANCEEVISKEILEKNDRHLFYNGVCMLCGGAEEDLTCDHEGKGTYTFTVEANCSNEGVVEVYCSGCADLISSEILEKNDNHFFYNGVCLLCGETDECKHDYVLVKEEAATCEYPAYFWYECSICGNELNYEDKTGALAEHTYEVVKSEPATCQYPAYYWYECSVCGEEMNREEGEVGDHDYEVVKSEPATCQYPAYYWYECSVCGEEMNREEGEVGDHDYEVVKSEPATCQYPAYYWYECSVCGEEMNREEGEIGEHAYEVVKSEPATCQYPAYYWYECSVCGEEMNREEGEADASAHKWNDGEVTTEPTVDAEGVMTFTCTECGETKTESIDKLEDTHTHDYESVVTEPTCTEAGFTTYTCECGDSYVADEVEALGHKEEYANKVAATCTTAGKEADTICSVCGEVIAEGAVIEALGHTEVSADNAVEADCTTAGKEADTICSVCGEVIAEGAAIPAKGHNAVSANNAVEADCTTAGKEADTVCSVCGEVIAEGAAIPAKGHTEKVTWGFNADFTKRVKTTTCTVCGEILSIVEEDY